MMCDVSSDSINLDGDDFERLQPSLRIADHATRDDSDESVERGGPHNLPSGCIELLITTVVPPEGLCGKGCAFLRSTGRPPFL